MGISSMYVGASTFIQNFIIGVAALNPKRWHDSFFYDTTADGWTVTPTGTGSIDHDASYSKITLATAALNDTANMVSDVKMNFDHVITLLPKGTFYRVVFGAAMSLKAPTVTMEDVGITLLGADYTSQAFGIAVRNTGAGTVQLYWKTNAGAHTSGTNISLTPGTFYNHEIRWASSWIEWYIDGVLRYSNHAASHVPTGADLQPMAYLEQLGAVAGTIELSFFGGDVALG